jgi:Delta3-Delta2-enoyl-CoA isomerase
MNASNTPLVVVAQKNQVRTLTMNMPRRYNGWTFKMMSALKAQLQAAADDDDTKVVILTGADPYYCAGVNLGGSLKLAPPRKLHAMIVEHNQGLFDSFLDFPKPLLAAVNGPSIGAAVTSSTLCDGIIASEKATFSTPFAKLGVAKEGCSSVVFARIMGEENAARMLEDEGWIPNGQQAHQIGLAQWCVPHETLLEKAQEIAEDWVSKGATKAFRGSSQKEELKAINAKESIQVADSFLSVPFLEGQFRFLWGKKKRGPAAMFFVLRRTHPIWSRFL